MSVLWNFCWGFGSFGGCELCGDWCVWWREDGRYSESDGKVGNLSGCIGYYEVYLGVCRVWGFFVCMLGDRGEIVVVVVEVVVF